MMGGWMDGRMNGGTDGRTDHLRHRQTDRQTDRQNYFIRHNINSVLYFAVFRESLQFCISLLLLSPSTWTTEAYYAYSTVASLANSTAAVSQQSLSSHISYHLSTVLVLRLHQSIHISTLLLRSYWTVFKYQANSKLNTMDICL